MLLYMILFVPVCYVRSAHLLSWLSFSNFLVETAEQNHQSVVFKQIYQRCEDDGELLAQWFFANAYDTDSGRQDPFIGGDYEYAQTKSTL